MAHHACSQGATLAIYLLQLIDETNRAQITHCNDVDDKIERLADRGTRTLSALIGIAREAEKVSPALMLEFAATSDDPQPVYVDGRPFSSFHNAACFIANQVLTAIWVSTDERGYTNNDFDGPTIKLNWPVACKRLREWEGGLPQLVDERLFVRLTKEASRAAVMRIKPVPPLPFNRL